MNNLRYIRTSKGKTLEEVASKLNWSKQALSELEKTSIHRMNNDRIEKLAKILEVDPIYMLGLDNFTIVPTNVKDAVMLINIIIASLDEEKQKEVLQQIQETRG